MNTFSGVKQIGAVILALSLFAPLGSCEMRGTPLSEGDPTTSNQVDPWGGDQYISTFHAYEYFLERDPLSWLAGLAFLWPLGLIAFSRLLSSERAKRVLMFMEPLLVCWTAYILWGVILFRTTEWGWYVALAGISLVTISVAVNVFVALKRLVGRAKSSHAGRAASGAD